MGNYGRQRKDSSDYRHAEPKLYFSGNLLFYCATVKKLQLFQLTILILKVAYHGGDVGVSLLGQTC